MQITVSGYKSISQEQSVEIRPLTILAGANSSGKSSIMQPLLLLKQTLEASYDPGALLLNGPNVRFTSADQLFSRIGKAEIANTFQVELRVGPRTAVAIDFRRHSAKGLDIQQMSDSGEKERIIFRLDMTHDEIMAAIPPQLKEIYEGIANQIQRKPEWMIVRNRCFLELQLKEIRLFPSHFSPGALIEPHIRKLIHLPGLRGNSERTYPVTAVSSTFPGTFENYAASVIAQWQTDRNHDKLEHLNRDLERLGLTWKVTAKRISDTQVELQVGRLTRAARGGAHDLVNIADIGFGVSQTLPVLVSLHAAEPEQLLYLEQPEIHLHPRAQYAMAQVLADAANRGVRVVAETHSSLLLLGVQALVAEGQFAPEKVKLHWFTRRSDGSTEIASADLDEAGAFGDWPEDFADVALEAESRYLDAAGAWGRKNGYGGKRVETPRH